MINPPTISLAYLLIEFVKLCQSLTESSGARRGWYWGLSVYGDAAWCRYKKWRSARVTEYQKSGRTVLQAPITANPHISCLRTSWDILSLGEIANININRNGKVSHKTWEMCAHNLETPLRLCHPKLGGTIIPSVDPQKMLQAATNGTPWSAAHKIKAWHSSTSPACAFIAFIKREL